MAAMMASEPSSCALRAPAPSGPPECFLERPTSSTPEVLRKRSRSSSESCAIGVFEKLPRPACSDAIVGEAFPEMTMWSGVKPVCSRSRCATQ